MNKKVSVIMSVYNEREDWLRKSIESILNQTYTNIEFIIIQDKPENSKLEHIILEYANQDERILFYKNNTNLGLVASLNRALEYTTGDYIARMDADDISMSERIEIQVADIEKGQFDLVATSMKFIDDEGRVIGYSGCYGTTVKKCIESLKIRNVLPHPTWLFKKEMLSAIGNYHNVQTAEDYEWLCRAACLGYKMHCIDKVLFNYRIRNNGVCVGKAYQQYVVSEIVKHEYVYALKRGQEFEYGRIINKLAGVDFSAKNDRFDSSSQTYKEGCAELKGGNKISGIAKILQAFFVCPAHMKHFVETIKLREVN